MNPPSLQLLSQLQLSKSVRVTSPESRHRFLSCRSLHCIASYCIASYRTAPDTMSRVSRLFQPLMVTPKNAVVKNTDITSKSQRLMLEMGLIRATNNASFHILPLCQRALEKLTRLIDAEMTAIGAQKITLPALTSAELWQKSGRLQNAGSELMTTKDRHGKVQILSPTHEEAVTSLLAAVSPVSYKQCPVRLYQIGTKFRDELKPRFGLIRTREFIMKDLYTFDASREAAIQTYRDVRDAYRKIFKRIGVPVVRVAGDTGTIGGTESHEFHFCAQIGEDSLVLCADCKFASNKELHGTEDKCMKCGSSNLERTVGIEVAHTFLLEQKYTAALAATVVGPDFSRLPLIMGCYGIGVTRLIAAAIEVLSTEDAIRWPTCLAPFEICLIPPKNGSKEEELGNTWTAKLLKDIQTLADDRDVIVDDRTTLTIGKRLMEAKRIGYPLIIVIGAKVNEEKFEFHTTAQNTTELLSHFDLLDRIVRMKK